MELAVGRGEILLAGEMQSHFVGSPKCGGSSSLRSFLC